MKLRKLFKKGAFPIVMVSMIITLIFVIGSIFNLTWKIILTAAAVAVCLYASIEVIKNTYDWCKEKCKEARDAAHTTRTAIGSTLQECAEEISDILDHTANYRKLCNEEFESVIHRN